MSSPSKLALATLLVVATTVCSVCALAGDEPPPGAQGRGGSSAAPEQAAAGLVTLEVHATGFDNDQGHAVAKPYRPGENVLGASSFKRAAEVR